MNRFAKNMFAKLTITAVLIVCFYFSMTDARPSENPSNDDLETSLDSSLYNGDLSPHVIRQVQKCERDLETMELCIRCAKVTKSEIVYPLCCDNEEGVKEFCRDYIYYGAAPSP